MGRGVRERERVMGRGVRESDGEGVRERVMGRHRHTHTLPPSLGVGDICLLHPSWPSVSIIRLSDIHL